jgi:hypothetical protein
MLGRFALGDLNRSRQSGFGAHPISRFQFQAHCGRIGQAKADAAHNQNGTCCLLPVVVISN